MGNQATRTGHVSAKKADSVTHTGDSANSANNLSKSSSGTELESNTHMQFLPIESLAKVKGQFTVCSARSVITGFRKSSDDNAFDISRRNVDRLLEILIVGTLTVIQSFQKTRIGSQNNLQVFFFFYQCIFIFTISSLTLLLTNICT